MTDRRTIVESNVSGKRVLTFNGESGKIIEVTTDTAEQEISHALDRVPVGFEVLEQDGDANIWVTTKNKTSIKVKSDTAGITMKIFIY